METRLRQEIHDGDAATRMLLENEIIPQIRIIAENHLDLNRKLDEIHAEMKKNELLPMQVSVLEKDVRKIKEKNWRCAFEKGKREKKKGLTHRESRGSPFLVCPVGARSNG